jgi:NAD-dependent deacetylase
MLERAAQILAGGAVVAFTGAGVSAESGIPTFRDRGGVWDRYDPSLFGTWEGIAQAAMTRPDQLARFLSEIRRTFAAARPNAAHVALATLEGAGLVDGVITQNVDGLHQEAGSREVVEVHGSLRDRVCLVCGGEEQVPREELLESLDRAVAALRGAFIPSFASLLPRCGACGGPARPAFVAFGQAVRDFSRAESMARGCRAMLVVGTSGEVEPAAGLVRAAREAGARIVEVGPGPTWNPADLRLDGRAGRILPQLAARILEPHARPSRA